MYQNSRLRRHTVPARREKTPRWPFILATGIIAVIVLGAFVLPEGKKERSVSSNTDNATTPNSAAPAFNKKRHSLDDPASPWVVVNKKRPLDPKTYQPAQLVAPNMQLEAAASSPSMQLVPEAATALEALNQAAQTEGIKLVVLSAYRSYATQTSVYNSEVRAYGQAQADRESARPGHSEHQTGWGVDLGAASGKCRIQTCFGDMAEGKWLAANAHKHGFIIRYTQTKEAVTGYQYEPWHLRYVGIDLATELHRTNIQTLEEFFDLPAAPAY